MWVFECVHIPFSFPFFLLNKLPGSKRESERDGGGGEEAVGVRGFSETWRPCR